MDDRHQQIISVAGWGETAVTVAVDPWLADHVWIAAHRGGEVTEILIDRRAAITLSAALATWAKR